MICATLVNTRSHRLIQTAFDWLYYWLSYLAVIKNMIILVENRNPISSFCIIISLLFFFYFYYFYMAVFMANVSGTLVCLVY